MVVAFVEALNVGIIRLRIGEYQFAGAASCYMPTAIFYGSNSKANRCHSTAQRTGRRLALRFHDRSLFFEDLLTFSWRQFWHRDRWWMILSEISPSV
jgi:hypothetical protein